MGVVVVAAVGVVAALAVAVTPDTAAAQDAPRSGGFCFAPPPPGELAPASDLYCLELVASPAAPGASGVVELVREATPFGASVTVDGRPLVRAVIRASGLPDPGDLGPFTAYVAWVTPPTMFPERSLGSVANGVTENGLIDLNKFAVLISAEPTSDVAERSGPIVLRGLSPATRLRPPDFLQFGLGSVPLAGSDVPPGGAPAHAEHEGADDSTGWRTPPMPPGIAMLPAMMRLRPDVAPHLPDPLGALGGGGGPLAEARPMRVERLANGQTLELEAGFVRRSVAGRELVM
ncbi:MAG: hypothetical protein ABFS41_16780, partial [Myxococcota bacterium]